MGSGFLRRKPWRVLGSYKWEHGPGSQESENQPKFFLLAIWDRIPGSWRSGSASILTNPKSSVISVPGNLKPGPSSFLKNMESTNS